MTTKDKGRRNPEALTLKASGPGGVEPQYAALVVDPSANAALTIRRANAPAPDCLTMDALLGELGAQAKAVHSGNLARGEAMLTAQAHTLDAIFNACARRAIANDGQNANAMETYYRIALRAQSLCRATWETLAQMKNPAPVAFVKQANIAAGPQQVNNEVSRPREIEKAPSKLLEAEHERMDTGAAALAGRSDPTLAPVGKSDRPKNGSR